MLLNVFAITILLQSVAAQQQFRGKSYTGWDCCKPICADRVPTQVVESRGVPKSCDNNNNVIDTMASLQATTGCSGGSAFMCPDFQPFPVEENLSYGFAVKFGGDQAGTNGDCCKCYEVEWTSGAARGKKMVLQNVTPGTAAGNVGGNDLIILTPGGGGGPFSQGCPRQFGSGYDWGGDYGGFDSGRSNCERLPSQVQAGCYWRFNWAGGEVNGWDISYRQVSCPSRLTDISGCSA